jgi:hypothetical protein
MSPKSSLYCAALVMTVYACPPTYAWGARLPMNHLVFEYGLQIPTEGFATAEPITPAADESE